MVVYEMSVCEMSVFEMSVYKMSVHVISIHEMSVHKISVHEMSGYEMFVYELSQRPNMSKKITNFQKKIKNTLQESCTKKNHFFTRRRKSHFFLTHPVCEEKSSES